MYKVETHDNSKQYFSQQIIEENSFYVTATTALSNMIKELSRISTEERWRIIDIESFIKLIYPKWTDTLNQLKLKAELRKILINLRLENKDVKIQNELIFLEDNLNILLSDVCFVAETGIKKLSYPSLSLTMDLFKLIYNKLAETKLFTEITEELVNVNMLKGFEGKIQGVKEDKISKLYFYNINYLDLKRYLIIELLKFAGYEIVFKIPYFSGLKVINKCWNLVYKDNSIFNFIENDKNFEELANKSRFISFLEGRDIISNIDELVVTKTYNEISSFKKDIKDKKVITFYKDSLKPCLGSQRDGLTDHCYQSSLGRFLLELYKCKLKDNTVYLDFNTYRELITSGWIESRGWNGIKLSEYLSDNTDYFNDIETIDDILFRINKIKELYEVKDIFEEPAKGRIKKSNLKGFLSNPFRAFGYINFEKYNITVNYFETLTIRLKNIILRSLEEKEELIEFSNQLEVLKIAFKNEYIKGLFKNGSEVEKRIINRIWTAINNKSFSGKLHKEEIQEFFNILLKFNKGNSGEKKEELDFSIDHLEGLILRDRMTNYKMYKAIYISDLSYKAYETYIQNKKIEGKIINYKDFNTIFNYTLQGEHKNIILKGLSLQDASSRAAEAYTKFAIGNLFINFNGIKEFSWIAGFRNDDDKSILFKQIEALYDKEIKLKQELDSTDIATEDEMIKYEAKAYDRKELDKGFSNLPEVAYRDLDFCDKKFLFTTLLEEHPIYYSDFHQRLTLAAIVSMLKESLDDSYSCISKYIFPLFPQWLDVVKENILTCEYARKNIRDYKYFDGINYPKSIDSLYLLKSKYIVTENSKIRNRYNKGDFKAEKYFHEFLKEYLTEDSFNSGIHCKMCPHIYLCRKGEFAIEHK